MGSSRPVVPPGEPKPGQPVQELLPPKPTLPSVRSIARGCKACDLYKRGTQTVFGAGPAKAEIMLVGEQPGDAEDLAGQPFVGPAGRLLDRALGEAGIERKDVYLTNAVKHFKFEQRGKRRIHAKPTSGEVSHYRWWLMRELELIEPKLVVALGGTAVLALTGKQVPITRARGPAKLLEDFQGYITVHPSYLLRLPDEDAKRAAYATFVDDMRRIREIGAANVPSRSRAA